MLRNNADARRCSSFELGLPVFVLVFEASCSGEVMIVSVPLAFQVRSLQGLVKLETELARRTGCSLQVKQLKSEKVFPCSSSLRSLEVVGEREKGRARGGHAKRACRLLAGPFLFVPTTSKRLLRRLCSSGNLKDSNACASTTLSWPLSTSKVWFLETPKTGTVLIPLPEINDFFQNRQCGSRSISLCFQMEQNTAHFSLIFPGVTHAPTWLTDNDLTDWWSAG